MRVADITMRPLEIPFKHTFAHAAASRSATESVLVTMTSTNGLIGHGEGCPRSYVTGETLDSCMGFFQAQRTRWAEIHTLDELREWTTAHQNEIDRNPAAWCAVETAFLDLFGQDSHRSLESLLGLRELSEAFHYSAVLGAATLDAFKTQLYRYASVGFIDFKIKITGKLDGDVEKIAQLKALNRDGLRIRVDANNLWKRTRQAAEYLGALQYPFVAIEEPLAVGDYAGLWTLSRDLSMPIVLDESFLRADQFSAISDTPSTWIINIRISKMGGILRSLAIAERATSLGIPIVIGAQVGETSILTRAALTVAEQYRNHLRAQEGAFGTLLLEHDLCNPALMFGKGGLLSVDTIKTKPGLGFTVTA